MFINISLKFKILEFLQNLFYSKQLQIWTNVNKFNNIVIKENEIKHANINIEYLQNIYVAIYVIKLPRWIRWIILMKKSKNPLKTYLEFSNSISRK